MKGAARRLKRSVFYLFVIGICLILISPFILMFSYSLRTDAEIFSANPSFFPRNPSLQAYSRGLFSYRVVGKSFFDWAKNSIIVCGASTLTAVLISSLCGYGISRFRFYGRTILWFIIILTQTVPWIVVLIPYYFLLGKMHMINKLSAIAISYMAILTPVCTWLFTGFFQSIPVEIEEAARIDGCNHLSVYARIILPIAIPGISAIALFAFVIGWSDYLIASILITSAENWTLPIGLSSFQSEHIMHWAEIMAMSTLITVPIIILFLYLQKNLLNLLAGGVKQ